MRGGARGGGVAGEKRADDATGRAQRRSGGARGLCDGARAEMEGGGGRPEECAGEQWRMEEEGNGFIPLAKGTGSKTQPVPMYALGTGCISNRCLRRGLRYWVSAQPVPKGPTAGK